MPVEPPQREPRPIRLGQFQFREGARRYRDLLPIRYQPSAGLVVNSPIEAPVLIEEVQHDWGGTGAREHEASLLADARNGGDLWKYGPALRRLRFYYPDEYRKQAVGVLKEKVRKFESSEHQK